MTEHIADFTDVSPLLAPPWLHVHDLRKLILSTTACVAVLYSKQCVCVA